MFHNNLQGAVPHGLFPVKRKGTLVPISTQLSTVLSTIATRESTLLPFRYIYSAYLKLTRISVQ